MQTKLATELTTVGISAKCYSGVNSDAITFLKHIEAHFSIDAGAQLGEKVNEQINFQLY